MIGRFVSTWTFLVCSVVGGAVLAAEVETQATSCAFEAWSKDPDPAGLNVRAGPRRDAAVVGRLPPAKGRNEDHMAVGVKVIGSRGGWFLIASAGWGDYGEGAEKPVFTGPGWVSGAMLDVQVQDEAIRAAPVADAEIVARPKERSAGQEYLKLGRLLSCTGGWVEIQGAFVTGATDAGRPVRGWVTNLCGNQVTTCP